MLAPRSPCIVPPESSAPPKRGIEASNEAQHIAAEKPRVDTATASTNRGILSIKLPRCKRCIKANADDCDRQRLCNNCKASGFDVAGCNDAQQNDRVGHTAAQDAQASLSKRKRETNDTGTENVLAENQTTRVPGQPASPKRQAMRTSGGKVEARLAGEQPGIVELVHKGAPPHVQDVTNDQSVIVAKNITESDTMNATSTRTPYSQVEEQPEVRFDLGALLRQMKELQKNVEHTALDLLTHIGYITNIPCSLDLKPSENLEALYVRCWGAKWKELAKDSLRRSNFGTPCNTMSLIAAFLYDKILDKQAYDKVVAQELITRLQGSGPTGEAILNALDWSERGKSHIKSLFHQITDASQRLRLRRPSLLSRWKKLGRYWPKMKWLSIPNCKRKLRL